MGEIIEDNLMECQQDNFVDIAVIKKKIGFTLKFLRTKLIYYNIPQNKELITEPEKMAMLIGMDVDSYLKIEQGQGEIYQYDVINIISVLNLLILNHKNSLGISELQFIRGFIEEMCTYIPLLNDDYQEMERKSLVDSYYDQMLFGVAKADAVKQAFYQYENMKDDKKPDLTRTKVRHHGRNNILEYV